MDESITVERIRHGLVVGRLDADGAAVRLAATLPPGRTRTVVVVGTSAADAMNRLDPWVVADLAEAVRGELCVVAPNFGSMAADGTLPPARLLADRLGVAVTAADGHPIGLDDGTVFVPGRGAGWVSFRPGGVRIPVGARFPAPWWQQGLPDLPDTATQIPAGLWIRGADAPDRTADPLLRRVPDRDRMYVVLGAPAEAPPPATVVADVLRALPDETRDRAVLAWYGSGGVAAAVADALGAPVRAAHGVPGDGGLVYVDEAGVARWRPFAVESVYRPGEPPTLDRWVAPPALAMIEPGSYRLVDGWRVDVVARGLVVRPETLRLDPAWAAETGPTADVVFAADRPVPARVLSAFDRLVGELPDDIREILRVLPTDEPAAAALAASVVADRVVPLAARPAGTAAPDTPAGLPVGAVVVAADGRVVPAAPILARPVTRPAAVAATTEQPAAVDSTIDIQDGVLVIALADEDAEVGAGSGGSIPSVAAASVTPPVAGSSTPPELIVPPPAAPRPMSAVAVRFTSPALRPMPAAGAVAPPPAGTRSAAGAVVAGAAAVPAARAVPSMVPQYAAASAGPEVPVAMTPPAVSAPPVAAAPLSPAESVTVSAPTPAETPPAAAPSPPTSTGSTVSTVDIALDGSGDSVLGLLPGRDQAPARPRQATATTPSAPIEVPEHVRSTAAQRRTMRGRLGSRYDVATRAVTRLLAERPGLRFGAGDRAALLTELAVVRVFAEDPNAGYDADFYVCLADGLRRLPTARAVVVRGIPADTDVRPESVLRLPAPAVAAPALPALPVGPAEALIWTTTARRLDGLLDDGPAAGGPADQDDPDEPTVPGHEKDVVLAGHTRLRVLAVETEPVHRILLAEDGAAVAAALTRLRAAAAARSAAVPGPRPAEPSRWFGPIPAA